MLKELLAIEVLEKYKSEVYLMDADWDQTLLNDLRLSLLLDKYGLNIPQDKIEHL